MPLIIKLYKSKSIPTVNLEKILSFSKQLSENNLCNEVQFTALNLLKTIANVIEQTPESKSVSIELLLEDLFLRDVSLSYLPYSITEILEATLVLSTRANIIDDMSNIDLIYEQLNRASTRRETKSLQTAISNLCDSSSQSVVQVIPAPHTQDIQPRLDVNPTPQKLEQRCHTLQLMKKRQEDWINVRSHRLHAFFASPATPKTAAATKEPDNQFREPQKQSASSSTVFYGS